MKPKYTLLESLVIYLIVLAVFSAVMAYPLWRFNLCLYPNNPRSYYEAWKTAAIGLSIIGALRGRIYPGIRW